LLIVDCQLLIVGRVWIQSAIRNRKSEISMIGYGSWVIGELREDGVDVGGNETRQVVHRTIQREDLSKTRSGDRQVPTAPGLRSKQRQLPAFECGSPSSNHCLHGSNQLGAESSVAELRTANGN
jgi:hypothetical protein